MRVRRIVIALVAIFAMMASGLGTAAVSAQTTGFELEARGTTGEEQVQVRVNGSTFATVSLSTSTATYSVAVPTGTTWDEVTLFWPDGSSSNNQNMDIDLFSFALHGDERVMVAGDVQVSGQWVNGSCSSLRAPVGNRLHCRGEVVFPAEDGGTTNPPINGDSPLDRSYWGNADTVVPVYDTAWDMGVQVTLAEGEEYMDFLVGAGFSGFATTYLGAIHRPAARPDQMPVYTNPDGLGHDVATYDAATGNLIMDPDHADHFEDLLDAAHDRGLRVMLLVFWERKSVEEYGLLNENNSYNWANQIGERFRDHPAIQTWTLGGDAGTDASRTQLWTNAVNGLRDAGVTGDINFHTGSAPARRVNQLNASWNTSQLVQTSHCAGTALATSRLEAVMAEADIPVWAGESRYEGIDATWCNPPVSIPTAQDIVTDAASFVNAGVAGIIYGHNERWQWGHGLEGSSGNGFNSVRDSFSAPGAYALIDALTVDDDGPTVIQVISPANGATGVTLPTQVSGFIPNPADVDFANITVSNADNSYVEVFNKDIGFLLGTDGTWSFEAPEGILLSSDQFTVEVYVEYNDETILTESSSFTVELPDVAGPVFSVDGPVGPVSAGVVSVVGTAVDVGSGVDSALVVVRNVAERTYWDGSEFGAGWARVIVPVDLSGDWAFDVPVEAGVEYVVQVYGRDVVGNLTSSAEAPWLNFTVELPDNSPIQVLSPADGSTGVSLPVTIEGRILNPDTVEFANITVSNADDSYFETFNKDIGFLLELDGSWSLGAPAGTLLSSDQFTVEVYVEYSDETVGNYSSDFTAVLGAT